MVNLTLIYGNDCHPQIDSAYIFCTYASSMEYIDARGRGCGFSCAAGRLKRDLVGRSWIPCLTTKIDHVSPRDAR